MPLSGTIPLVRVLHHQLAVHQVLPVHRLDRSVRSLKVGECDEAVPLAAAGVRVPHHTGRVEDDAKGTERIVQHLLIHIRVQVADEKVGAHALPVRLVRARLVDTKRLQGGGKQEVRAARNAGLDGRWSLAFPKNLSMFMILMA